MNDTNRIELLQSSMDAPTYCIPDAEGHCITCSDEALLYTVVRVDAEHALAEVSVAEAIGRSERMGEIGGMGGMTEEIDISLVDDVVPGNVVLVHGGVAIALVSEANNE